MDLLEGMGFLGNGREIPVAGHFVEFAVELPGPAVERTAQVVQTFLILMQNLPAAMQAGVGEGMELILTAAHNDVGKIGDVVLVTVADIGDVVFVTGQLPGALPDLFLFLLEDLA